MCDGSALRGLGSESRVGTGIRFVYVEISDEVLGAQTVIIITVSRE